MRHREEQRFELTLHLSAEFPEDYDGDDDGLAWHREFLARTRARVIQAVFDALREEPGWKVRAAPRGRNPDLAVDIEVQRVTRAGLRVAD